MNKRLVIISVIMTVFLAVSISTVYAQEDEGFFQSVLKFFGFDVEQVKEDIRQKGVDYVLNNIWWVILLLGIAFIVARTPVGGLRSLSPSSIVNSFAWATIAGLALSILLGGFGSPSLLLWVAALASAIEVTFGLTNAITSAIIGAKGKAGVGKGILSRAAVLARFGRTKLTEEEKKQLQELERKMQPRRIRTLLVVYEEAIEEDWRAKGIGYRVEDIERTIVDTLADVRKIEKKQAEEEFEMWKRFKGLE